MGHSEHWLLPSVLLLCVGSISCIRAIWGCDLSLPNMTGS